MAPPRVEAFFDSATSTFTYLVYDRDGGHAAIVDPVLDFDARSGEVRTASADRIVAAIAAKDLKADWILETHAHADHLSAAHYLRGRLGARVAIGRGICEVQRSFGALYNLGADFATDGSQFDRLLDDGEQLAIGELTATAWLLGGHTPSDTAYLVGDAVFVGDTIFMPDVGTARTDFPGGDAAVLYASVRRLLDLPPQTRLFVCHDYPPAGRVARHETTVAEQRESNLHVRDAVAPDEFVQMRRTRDATLAAPALLLPAIQVNIRAGRMPPPESNGTRYLKLPLRLPDAYAAD